MKVPNQTPVDTSLGFQRTQLWSPIYPQDNIIKIIIYLFIIIIIIFLVECLHWSIQWLGYWRQNKEYERDQLLIIDQSGHGEIGVLIE